MVATGLRVELMKGAVPIERQFTFQCQGCARSADIHYYPLPVIACLGFLALGGTVVGAALVCDLCIVVFRRLFGSHTGEIYLSAKDMGIWALFMVVSLGLATLAGYYLWRTVRNRRRYPRARKVLQVAPR